MVISISYGIFIVVCSLAAYTFDLTMNWSYTTNVGEVWNLALCSVGIVLLLFLCVDIRRYVNLVLDMHEGSNSVSGIKLVEGEDGELHIEVSLQTGQKNNVPEYYGFTTGRLGAREYNVGRYHDQKLKACGKFLPKDWSGYLLFWPYHPHDLEWSQAHLLDAGGLKRKPLNVKSLPVVR